MEVGVRLMLPNERRARLGELVAQHGANRASLSRLIGRGTGYLGRYLREAVPYDLAEQDRDLLARYFGVDADTLRPAPPTHPRARRWR